MFLFLLSLHQLSLLLNYAVYEGNKAEYNNNTKYIHGALYTFYKLLAHSDLFLN